MGTHRTHRATLCALLATAAWAVWQGPGAADPLAGLPREVISSITDITGQCAGRVEYKVGLVRLFDVNRDGRLDIVLDLVYAPCDGEVFSWCQAKDGCERRVLLALEDGRFQEVLAIVATDLVFGFEKGQPSMKVSARGAACGAKGSSRSCSFLYVWNREGFKLN